MADTNLNRLPTVYINHGGGPLPLLGRQPRIVDSLKKTAARIPKPDAIVIVSAHFESEPVTIMSAAKPGMLYDYGGFPKETYEYRYDAPGNPKLAEEIGNTLSKHDIPYRFDSNRGYDHGIFVPLMCMYPDADIPVLSVSLPTEPTTMWKFGEYILAPLREKGVLIIGSGGSFHNFSVFFKSRLEASDVKNLKVWDDWVRETACNENVEERKKSLLKWREHPLAKWAHPTPEHFTPLVVIAAAGGTDVCKPINPQDTGNESIRTSEFIFGAQK